MGHIAAFGIEAGHVEDDGLRVRLDGLCGLELFFGLLGVVLDGVELPKNHAVLNALRGQRNDLLVFGNGQIEHVGGSACRGLTLAELAEIDAAELLVGFQIVRRIPDGFARCEFCVVDAPGAEVKVGESVVDLGRGGVGIEGKFVLFDGAGNVFGPAQRGGIVLVERPKGEVVVGHGAVGGGCCGCRCGRDRSFARSDLRGCGRRDTKRSGRRTLRENLNRRQESGRCGNRKPEGGRVRLLLHHVGIPRLVSPEEWRKTPFRSAERQHRQPLSSALPTVQTILTVISRNIQFLARKDTGKGAGSGTFPGPQEFGGPEMECLEANPSGRCEHWQGAILHELEYGQPAWNLSSWEASPAAEGC